MSHSIEHLSIGLDSAAVLAPSAEFVSADATAFMPTVVVNHESYVVAQSFDQDVLGDIKDGFTNFVETGQVWALLFGLILGFVIRGLTR